MRQVWAWISLLFVACGTEMTSQTIAKGQYYVKETPVGLGIFAAKELEPFDVLQTTLGIPIPISLIVSNQLINYVKGYNSTHGLFILGIGSLFNHAMDPNKVNVREFITTLEDSTVMVTYEYNSVIFPDEELLISYGDEDWFTDRNIVWQEIESSHFDHLSTPPATLQLSNQQFGDIGELMILQNHKLFARTVLSAGQSLELSRVLLLPLTARLWHHQHPLLDQLLWYGDLQPVFAREDDSMSPYVVAPFNASHAYVAVFTGWASLLSPAVTHGVSGEVVHRRANVQAEWVDRTGHNTVGLVCFRAIEQVEQGEELVLQGFELMTLRQEEQIRSRKVLSLLQHTVFITHGI